MLKPMGSRVCGIGPRWLERRQLGSRNPLGTADFVYKQMYSSYYRVEDWNHPVNNVNSSSHGGVFSLEFSPEGSLLVAACEKRSVLVFDPLTYKEVYAVENAHDDCVNCVKFLDSRSFATCSDDYTVALWDARNLSQKVRSLRGHTNWVKNIEYCSREGLLVTSGFDGNVLTWEMNKYREGGTVYNKVFATNGLMRMCLTPDASKMLICTTGGYLIVIHNLDLNSLTQDLGGFKPNMYRLMQLSQTILPIASDFTHLFRGHGKRNRVEFVTDFPEDDDAEVISSLQVHPDGHSVISRNVSNGEQSEWSCVHNIEERISSDESDCSEAEDSDEDGYINAMNWSGSSTSISTTPSYIIQHAQIENSSRYRTEEGRTVEQRDLSVSPADVWEALVAIQEARVRRERDMMPTRYTVRHMFGRQAEIQVRPMHAGPEDQVFVARPLSNAAAADGDGRRGSAPSASAPSQPSQPQRTTTTSSGSSVSCAAGQRHMDTAARRRARRKIPPRLRYCSLYRRSLVGQYDRTSISRKPIYRSRVTNMRLMRRVHPIIKLNTNYEMNETQRLQIESRESVDSPGASLNAVAGIARARRTLASQRSNRQTHHRGGSGAVSDNSGGSTSSRPGVSGTSRFGSPEGSLQAIRRMMQSALRSTLASWDAASSTSSSNQVDSTVNSTFNTIRVIENNLNSIRQTMTTFEGRIQVLRRSLLSLGESNNNNAGDSLVDGGEAQPPTQQHQQEDEEQQQQPPPQQQVAEVQDRTGEDESSESNGEQNERTIFVGVFRAGSGDGIRGTSMRRHNIAAVTVSSTSQGPANTELMDVMRSRRSGPGKSYPSVPINRKIHQNIKRLTHYTEEPNVGKGFIKDLCVSPDGRVICSPYANGVRILSFSPDVQDLSRCYPYSGPIPLNELLFRMSHIDTVVSTRFSPHHNLLVSGCLSGKIVYYQPIL